MNKSLILFWFGVSLFLLLIALSYQTKGMELYFLISKFCL